MRRTHQLDVIDHRAAVARDALVFKCAADAKRVSGEFGRIFQLQRSVDASEKEPIAAPSDVTDDRADAWNFDGNRCLSPVAADILHRDVAVRLESDFYIPDGRFEAMHARFDAAEVSERGNNPDRAMPTHAQVAGVVEEDDTRDCLRRNGRLQDRPNHAFATAAR